MMTSTRSDCTLWQQARRSGAIAVALIGLVALIGCQQAVPSEAPAESPRVVTDGLGEQVRLPADPQRALGFYTTDVDILITLEVPLAPLQPIRGDGYTDFPEFFPEEPLQGIETYANYPEYNFEKTLAAEPDLILNGLGYDDEAVKRLAEIAPTYNVNAFDGKDWRVPFEETARAIGRMQQYRKWTDGYAEQLATAKQQLADSGADQKKVAALGYSNGEFSLGCYGVPCRTLRDDLGLEVPKQMQRAEATLSAEQLGQLDDVDAVFFAVTPGSDGRKQFEQTMTELDRIPTWRGLGFVQKGEIHTYDMEMLYGSPSGQTAFLDVARKALR